MTIDTFDSLSAARNLEAVGITKRHAYAIVQAMNEAIGERLATKTDLELLKADLAHLKADLEHLASKADLYKVAIGVVLANVGLTATVIRLLM